MHGRLDPQSFDSFAQELANLESDRYLSPQAFEQRDAAVFPGAGSRT
jgi:hypothetical protein